MELEVERFDAAGEVRRFAFGTCEVEHVGLVVSGRAAVRMDGTG
jgi:hypothetical protein